MEKKSIKIKEYRNKLSTIDREILDIKSSIGDYRKNNFGHERLSLAFDYLKKQRQLVVMFLKDLEYL